MSDRPRSPGPGDDRDVRYDDEPTSGIPRWAKIAGIVVAIVVLLIVVMMIIGGGGQHNPLRHAGLY